MPEDHKALGLLHTHGAGKAPTVCRAARDNVQAHGEGSNVTPGGVPCDGGQFGGKGASGDLGQALQRVGAGELLQELQRQRVQLPVAHPAEVRGRGPDPSQNWSLNAKLP